MEKQYYRTFSSYLRERYGQKVYRVCLDAGFTCPNRDGTVGTEGCAYCSSRGSWSGSVQVLPLKEQVRIGKAKVRQRYGARKFIAYFQAYSNTYAPVNSLKEIYDSALAGDEDFVGLAIGTRPDCIDREKLELIASYKKTGLEVWIEYGLQSANDSTLRLIGRGHTSEDFSSAVLLTKEYGILVSAHVIIGLPEENREDVVNTAEFLSGLPVDGVKIHNLNIVKDTRMAGLYYEGKIKPLSLLEYAGFAVDFLEHLNPDIVVERLVAESNPVYLIEPRWSLNKQAALNAITGQFMKRDSYQGKLFKYVQNKRPGESGKI
ncbi:MAG: TIGR01212 family radical SAM protein [Spirochaetes bacterium]|nr:TIGR01212 family radical SAM protein [Spirochaetota bacterium]